MNELPDLSRLNVAEKDQRIRELWSWVRNLPAQVTTFPRKVGELEARLAQNSRHSSQPPSSDGLSKPNPKLLRKAGQHPNGGQKGHLGRTVTKGATPDRTETHLPPPHGDACGTFLTEPTVVETRPVFDLPRLGFEVTEPLVFACPCAACGKICRGEFPVGVVAPVQVGPAARAAMVHLTHPGQAHSGADGGLLRRTEGARNGAGGLRKRGCSTGADGDLIGQALQTAQVAHADETGRRVAGQRHGRHARAVHCASLAGID